MNVKLLFAFCYLLLIACNGNSPAKSDAVRDTVSNVSKKDSNVSKKDSTKDVLPGRVYSNQRFKEVKVEKIGTNDFRITGKGQIFEANFNWVLKSDSGEIKKGYTMTDAGAPEWGNFNFIVTVPVKSNVSIVLFESSAKDGSRQYELPITLY